MKAAEESWNTIYILVVAIIAIIIIGTILKPWLRAAGGFIIPMLW